MGMDVYGVEPKGKKGEYFRNSCWSWRPLWDFVYEECPDVISERDHEAGHYNDGYLISAEKAERVANRLRALCASGKVLDFEREYKQHMDSLPDEICTYCNGTGDRKDLEPPTWKQKCGGCNVCHGKGTVRPRETHYPFEAENVLEFAEFCEASGGFKIL